MNSKLTLSIEKDVIEQAKVYAADQGRSLSNVVEQYLKTLSKKNAPKKDKKFHPLVEELAGSVKLRDTDKDYKELITDALVHKYLK